MGVFLFVLCFALLLSGIRSVKDIIAWIVIGMFVIIGLIYPTFLGCLIVYGIPALVAYAVIASICAALWRHIRGSSGSAQPPCPQNRAKRIRGRLPRDLLLPEERL